MGSLRRRSSGSIYTCSSDPWARITTEHLLVILPPRIHEDGGGDEDNDVDEYEDEVLKEDAEAPASFGDGNVPTERCQSWRRALRAHAKAQRRAGGALIDLAVAIFIDTFLEVNDGSGRTRGDPSTKGDG